MTMTQAALQNLSPVEIVDELGREAKAASSALSQSSEEQINAVLKSVAEKLRSHVDALIEANKKDLDSAEQRGLSGAMVDRLALNPERIEGMAAGVEVVMNLPDPVGKLLSETQRPNGLRIEKVSVPIGVLGMIYESRPNVTIDASALCLKSRNAVILRGGSESLHSSLALHSLIQEALEEHGFNPACVSMIPISDREAVGALLRADRYVDVMIPRGGKGLVERVQNEARMPVFSHLDGICHVYIDRDADPVIAREVSLNAKMRRTGICGAMETLLLNKDLSNDIAQDVVKTLLDEGCAVVGDKMAQSLDPRIGSASSEDWGTEYLDAKVSVAIVDNVNDAVNHINSYGSHHTDSIITQNDEAAAYFHKNVDSGIVMRNASTQFADGGEFGMGAEIGIATGKMHARGPVGLEQLCTYKYLVHGTGQTRP